LPGRGRFEFDEDGQGGCSADGALHMQEDKVGQSAQLHELCSILDSCGSTSCTLVFVQTRDAAETLCSYLRRRFPALGCEKVIGQGGADGMRWARQSGVLQRFRAGTTKLIVSTSVLEEGSYLFCSLFPLAVWLSVHFIKFSIL
jgi:ERCC4-related helicase